MGRIKLKTVLTSHSTAKGGSARNTVNFKCFKTDRGEGGGGREGEEQEKKGQITQGEVW